MPSDKERERARERVLSLIKDFLTTRNPASIAEAIALITKYGFSPGIVDRALAIDELTKSEGYNVNDSILKQIAEYDSFIISISAWDKDFEEAEELKKRTQTTLDMIDQNPVKAEEEFKDLYKDFLKTRDESFRDSAEKMSALEDKIEGAKNLRKEAEAKGSHLNVLNHIDNQIQIMENTREQVLDMAWTKYKIHSMGTAYDASKGVNSQERMGDVKKDAEATKAFEEQGKQMLANGLLAYKKKDTVAGVQADEVYAAVDQGMAQLKAAHIQQQAALRPEREPEPSGRKQGAIGGEQPKVKQGQAEIFSAVGKFKTAFDDSPPTGVLNNPAVSKNIAAEQNSLASTLSAKPKLSPKDAAEVDKVKSTISSNKPAEPNKPNEKSQVESKEKPAPQKPTPNNASKYAASDADLLAALGEPVKSDEKSHTKPKEKPAPQKPTPNNVSKYAASDADLLAALGEPVKSDEKSHTEPKEKPAPQKPTPNNVSKYAASDDDLLAALGEPVKPNEKQPKEKPAPQKPTPNNVSKYAASDDDLLAALGEPAKPNEKQPNEKPAPQEPTPQTFPPKVAGAAKVEGHNMKGQVSTPTDKEQNKDVKSPDQHGPHAGKIKREKDHNKDNNPDGKGSGGKGRG